MTLYTLMGRTPPICEECLIKLQRDATEAGQPILADEVAVVNHGACACGTIEVDPAQAGLTLIFRYIFKCYND